MLTKKMIIIALMLLITATCFADIQILVISKLESGYSASCPVTVIADETAIPEALSKLGFTNAPEEWLNFIIDSVKTYCTETSAYYVDSEPVVIIFSRIIK